jgi:hypothetical protein
MFTDLNGGRWEPAPHDVDEAEEAMFAVAAKSVDAAWLAACSASAFVSGELSPGLSPTQPHSTDTSGLAGSIRILDPNSRNESTQGSTRRTCVKALITRRSRVQIPPPPPTKVQVRGPEHSLGAFLLLLVVLAFGGSW